MLGNPYGFRRGRIDGEQNPRVDPCLENINLVWTDSVHFWWKVAVLAYSCLNQSVLKVVWQKPILLTNLLAILYMSSRNGYVDGFVGELTSAKRLSKHLVCDKLAVFPLWPRRMLRHARLLVGVARAGRVSCARLAFENCFVAG